MKDFHYCIWLNLNEEHPLHKFLAFKPHVTLRKNIKTKKEAIQLFEQYKKNYFINRKKIWMKVVGNEIGETDDFVAFIKNLKPIEKDDTNFLESFPHLSVYYKYDKINEEEKSRIEEQYKFLDEEYLLFDKISLNYCSGHFTNWFSIS